MPSDTRGAQEEGGNTANVRQGNLKRLFFSLGESRKVWSPHKLGDSFNSDLEGFKQTKCPTREQASSINCTSNHILIEEQL